jgi:hypothetical protein
MIWREKQILLITLAALLLGNIVFFLTYRVQYQSRLDEMDARLEQAEAQLNRSREARATAEQSVAAYRNVERDVQRIFDTQWSTQPRRLTRFIAEVKRLAEASNALPRSIGISRGDASARVPGTSARTISGEDLGAREVGIAFSVDATYEQTRRMINLFELSDQFVIIDQISLTEATDNRLSLNLRLKTLFHDDTLPAVADKRL